MPTNILIHKCLMAYHTTSYGAWGYLGRSSEAQARTPYSTKRRCGDAPELAREERLRPPQEAVVGLVSPPAPIQAYYRRKRATVGLTLSRFPARVDIRLLSTSYTTILPHNRPKAAFTSAMIRAQSSMSEPSTPARSIALSAFSTPSTAQHGTSPQELTPRSKIRAILAAIDDESNPESHANQGDKQSSREALATVAGNVQKAQRQKILDYNSTGEVDEGNSDEEPIVPRGRLAARLQCQASKYSDSSPDRDSEDKENAYARIKEQLLQRGPKSAREITFDFEADLSPSKNDTSKISPTEACRSSGSPRIPDPSNKNTPIRIRRPSPGLFLSPRSASGPRGISQSTASNDNSDSDLPANPQTNSRFLELVARKRAERESKQAEEDKKRAERFAKQRSFQQQLSRDASSASGLSDDDRITERKLTQQARPTRKASKKALEEMNRETQRMSRNMQLAHQAKTKKKITKDSLFARFNFRTSASPNIETPQNASSSTIASSRPASDVEAAVNEESPPTSPIRPDDHSMGAVDPDAQKDVTVLDSGTSHIMGEEDELPSMVDILSQPMWETDKAKGKAGEQSDPNARPQRKGSKRTFTYPSIRIRRPKPPTASIDRDSDSDLEIMPTRNIKKARTDVFDRLPAAKVQDARSLQTLRALARLNSPEKQAHGKKVNISLAEMQSLLQKRARQQATEERAEKIAELKSRGIIVQTAEERHKDQVEVEDLLEKARREGEELKQQEKRAAKNEKTANGEVVGLPDTSDEDEDYRDDEEPDVELSGSEDEQQIIDDYEESASDAEECPNEEEEEGEGALDGKGLEQHGLIDNEASEDGDDEGEAEEDDDGTINDDIDEDNAPSRLPLHRSRRSRLVVGDDEDEDETRGTQSPSQDLQFPGEGPTFPPGLGSTKLNCEPMGMTQAFAATMADTQTQAEAADEEQDSMAFLGPPPEPNFPMFDVYDSPQVIEDSQNGLHQTNGNNDQNTGLQEIRLDFSQSQIQYGALGDTQDPAMTTQVSEMPDPTQDVGFALSSPAPERFVDVPQSTADTVLLTPLQKPRRRLQRRLMAREEASDVEEVPSSPAHAGIDVPANAFDVMKKAKKDTSAADMFDKKKSEAKTMVEEQAQESEDEYAGLGGASDDESGGEEDDYVKEIIDQEEVNVDERQLAALYA